MRAENAVVEDKQSTQKRSADTHGDRIQRRGRVDYLRQQRDCERRRNVKIENAQNQDSPRHTDDRARGADAQVADGRTTRLRRSTYRQSARLKVRVAQGQRLVWINISNPITTSGGKSTNRKFVSLTTNTAARTRATSGSRRQYDSAPGTVSSSSLASMVF